MARGDGVGGARAWRARTAARVLSCLALGLAVGGVPSAGVTERFYFDAGSGLLVRRQITTRTPLNGPLTETFDYSMYRAVNGVMMAHTIKRNNWAVLDTFTVTDIKTNSAIDDSRFVKPKG